MNKILLMMVFLAFVILNLTASITNGLKAWWGVYDMELVDRSGNGLDDVEFHGNSGLYLWSIYVNNQLNDVEYEESGYVSLPAMNFNAMKRFTLSMWVFEDEWLSTLGGSYIEFSKGHSSICIAHGMHYDLSFIVGNAAVVIPFKDEFSENWVHYVMTFSKGVLKVYVNGKLEGSDTGTFNVGHTRGSIGDGDIAAFYSDVRIYDRALSQSEITELYRFEDN